MAAGELPGGPGVPAGEGNQSVRSEARKGTPSLKPSKGKMVCGAMKDQRPGAQTERRGEVEPVKAALGCEISPAACLNPCQHVVLRVAVLREWQPPTTSRWLEPPPRV
jgi:hypothetical protein